MPYPLTHSRAAGMTYTLSCWYFPLHAPDPCTRTLFKKGAGLAAAPLIQVTAGDMRILVTTLLSTQQIASIASFSTLTPGCWNHLALVVERGRHLQLYLNGQMDVVDSLQEPMICFSDEGWEIGLASDLFGWDERQDPLAPNADGVTLQDAGFLLDITVQPKVMTLPEITGLMEAATLPVLATTMSTNHSRLGNSPVLSESSRGSLADVGAPKSSVPSSNTPNVEAMHPFIIDERKHDGAAVPESRSPPVSAHYRSLCETVVSSRKRGVPPSERVGANHVKEIIEEKEIVEEEEEEEWNDHCPVVI